MILPVPQILTQCLKTACIFESGLFLLKSSFFPIAVAISLALLKTDAHLSNIVMVLSQSLYSVLAKKYK
ncbi:MAG: hypothetical protein K2X66_09840 [Cyanobacteria bacterium]|nr:hypothetical protein [Cyanobacteriota bacterium]